MSDQNPCDPYWRIDVCIGIAFMLGGLWGFLSAKNPWPLVGFGFGLLIAILGVMGGQNKPP